MALRDAFFRLAIPDSSAHNFAVAL